MLLYGECSFWRAFGVTNVMVSVLFEPVLLFSWCLTGSDVWIFRILSSVTSPLDSDVIKLCTAIIKLWDSQLYTVNTANALLSTVCLQHILKVQLLYFESGFLGSLFALKSLSDLWPSEKFSQPFDLLKPCHSHAWKNHQPCVCFFYFYFFYLFWVGRGVFKKSLDLSNVASPSCAPALPACQRHYGWPLAACRTAWIFILLYFKGVVGSKMDLNGNEISSSWTPFTGAPQESFDAPSLPTPWRPGPLLFQLASPVLELTFESFWTRIHQDWLQQANVHVQYYPLLWVSAVPEHDGNPEMQIKAQQKTSAKL